MSFKQSTSQNIDDYEILIRRRGETEYASYCPQLNYMLTGDTHEEVEDLMYNYVKKHVEKLKNDAVEN